MNLQKQVQSPQQSSAFILETANNFFSQIPALWVGEGGIMEILSIDGIYNHHGKYLAYHVLTNQPPEITEKARKFQNLVSLTRNNVLSIPSKDPESCYFLFIW